MTNNYYSILLMVSAGGGSASRSFLMSKNFSEELIDKCIENKDIFEVRKNDLGEPVYKITDLGRAKRDER